MTDVLDPTQAAMPDLGALPDIGLDTELNTDSQPFLGVCVIDQYQPNYNKDGWEWMIGVRPVDYVLRGESGCYRARAGISTNVNSKMAMMLKPLRILHPNPKIKIGKGELLGFAAIWIRRTLQYTMQDGSERSSYILIPVRLPDPAEQARCEGVSLVAGENNPAPQNNPAQPAVDLSDEDIKAMLDVMVGKTPAEFQTAALSSPLPPNLMNLILSGKGLDILKDRGAANLGDDGKVAACNAVGNGKKPKKTDDLAPTETDSLI